MLRTLCALAAGLLLTAGCGPIMEQGLPSPTTAGAAGAVLDASGQVPAAPGRQTLLDDKALITALASADTLATTVDALVDAGVLVPGSARALAVRDGLSRLRAGLRAASQAQRAGEAQTYAEALTRAAQAAQDIASAVRGG